MRRIRADIETYELRNGVIRKARRAYMCDNFGCESRVTMHSPASWQIQPGHEYVHLSHGLRICMKHIDPADIVDVSA